MVFHLSLSDNKSPQVSGTFLSILAVLNNVVVLMVSNPLHSTPLHLYPVMANGIRRGDPVDSIKDVVRNSVKAAEFDKHLKKAGGHIDRNVVEITIKMKTIFRKPLMIKIIKLRLRNSDN